MMLELVNGKPPYLGEMIDIVCFNILTASPPAIDEYRWSEHMRDFLQLCLIKDPVLRPNTDELLAHPFITNGNTDEVRENARKAFVKLLVPFRESKKNDQPDTILNAT
jgi:serine/threonine-protein kinase 24/25/MST4